MTTIKKPIIELDYYVCPECKERRVKMFASVPELCPDCEQQKWSSKSVYMRLSDSELINWLSAHATFIVVINDDGSDCALKINDEYTTLRDILTRHIVR